MTLKQEIARLYSSKYLLLIKHSQLEKKLKICQERPDSICGRVL